MNSALIEFLQGRILDCNSELLQAGYPNLDRKEVMAKNLWQQLPDKIQAPLYKREAFQQVVNFANHVPDYMAMPGATNSQQVEYLMLHFMERYFEWLKKNGENYDVKVLLNATIAGGKEMIVPPEATMFDSLTTILMYRYAQSQVPTNTPEPEAA